MNTKPLVHGSFTIERSYAAGASRVFAAWADVETKARWFIGPPEQWKLEKRELDFRVGGKELLRGVFSGGPVSSFEARYHVIVPNQRLVYVYDMFHGDRQLSVSLASVELAALKGGGTRMTFTEQAVFLDGEDGTRSREVGTAAHFERLGAVLADPREIVSARIFAAPRAAVFLAFAEPDRLTSWWGPKGFENEFHEFDFRPGGAWRFSMRGPDGTSYPMHKVFVEVVRPERIAFDHLQEMHQFRMTMSFVEVGDQTELVWRMVFESAEAAEPVRQRIEQANEENFDRLEQHLANSR